MSRRKWFTAFLCLGLLLTVLIRFSEIAVSQVVSPLSPELAELRGVWLTNIDSDVLFSRDRIVTAVERLKNLHFNTIYPAVWNWGYTLYPSAIAQQAIGHAQHPEPGLKKRDMLAEVLRHGHRQGLSVIPWLEFGLMAPANSELARRHPDWLTRRRDGSRIERDDNHPRVWLNPFHPDVQQFIIDLVSELVTNYDIDGIQLDDHFGLPVDFGYDSYTRMVYRREHGGNRPPANAQDPEWMRWRANKITDLMERVSQAVKTRRKNCLVTLAPNPYPYSYRTSLQDWQDWERKGWIDELVIQVYRNDLNQFIKELRRPEVQAARHHIPVSIGILAGLKDRPVSIEQIQNQVKAVRTQNLAGVSFFYYETLGDRNATFQALFPTPAERPTPLKS